ncbi:hypothetical protein N7478_007981 [Penicillium angulare]|uniref:uncharacterized protein n=1 Tax=Penicillium angulare TaxID=116970 RepID=UPI002542480D|nr:uncharacterized protein N7478_007981 [Penicillium angulare]KAJ5272856.1 hypothetical protein N7478_007981 [Penicillium angulare]
MARGGVKSRELDWTSVGTQGRRTGITLKEGKRDEHGMEEVDGLFSSPEKSPTELNGFDDEGSEDSIGSEGMSIEDGNAPGPLDYLNPQSNTRTSLLSAPGRSPAKGRSAFTRRSPDLHSTPEPEGDLLSSSPSDDRSLNVTRPSRQEHSPLTARSANANISRQRVNSQRTTKAQMAASEPTVLPEFSDGEGDENANSFLPGDDDQYDSFGAGDDTVLPDGGDDYDDDVAEPITENHSEPEDEDENEDEEPPKTSKNATSTSKETKKGLAKKSGNPGKTESSGPKGRPAKTARPVDEDDDEAAAADARPTKKQKTLKKKPEENRAQLDPELEKVVENYAQRSGPLKGRSLYILKRENPTDPASTHTRSGRTSIRPLAYWRNERCVYGDNEAVEDGHRFPLSTIKEIVRTEELEPEQKKKGKKAGRKGKSKKRGNESSDDEDGEADIWEKEGVLHGYIPRWDPKTQASSKDEDILDIAYAPSGIETREVKDSTFRFAKLLSSSFIGSGVVELPPEGVKRPKNSKKMHMVFYVCHGRVQVDISGVQFSAGKGCVFQVPRGNYYSFQNAHRKEARLFFTQGCVPEDEASPTSQSRPAVQESEFEVDGEVENGAKGGSSAASVRKARGRPKAKPKAKQILS